MSKQWDDKMKRIFAASPQDFVTWLLPGARFVKHVSLELKTVSRTITTDALSQVLLREQDAILHLEFQKQMDPTIVKRVWEYNVLATLEHDCPVYSFVIYLMPGGKVPDPSLEVGLDDYPKVHRFWFTNVTPWTLSVQDIRQWKLKGLLPLCFLTKNGASREVAQEVFDELKEDGLLLTFAMTMASMVFTSPEDQEWMKWRYTMLDEIMRETWFYQGILQEGRQTGLDEGLQKGRQEALLQQRQSLTSFVEARFPDLVVLAQVCADRMHDPDHVQRLLLSLFALQTSEQVQDHLLKALKRNEH